MANPEEVNLGKEFSRTLVPWFLVMVGTILILRILHALPPYLGQQEEPGLRLVNSVREAQVVLGKPLVLPAYFPDYLAWPPQEIKVQREPYLLASLVIYSRQQKEPILWIYQGVGSFGSLARALPWEQWRPDGVEVSLGRVRARLSSFRTREGSWLFSLAWEQEDLKLILVGHLPQGELTRIARSMALQR